MFHSSLLPDYLFGLFLFRYSSHFFINPHASVHSLSPIYMSISRNFVSQSLFVSAIIILRVGLLFSSYTCLFSGRFVFRNFLHARFCFCLTNSSISSVYHVLLLWLFSFLFQQHQLQPGVYFRSYSCTSRQRVHLDQQSLILVIILIYSLII